MEAKSNKKRIGGERKEFTNGTTGEACLAKPRLPKAKTPFRVLPVWIDAFPSFQDSGSPKIKNEWPHLRNSQWEIPPCHRGASVTIHSIRRARGVRGGSVCLPVYGEAIRRSRASPDSIYTVKQAQPPASTQTTKNVSAWRERLLCFTKKKEYKAR